MSPFIKKHGIAGILCFLSFCLLSYFAYYNEYCEGGADNYWHYYFSKYAFTYPDFFLHHWGKPLFILASSVFSQAGFYGIKLFNILCGISAAIVAYKFAIELKFKHSWAVIIILIFSPLYFFVLQSSLTEPLMSLLLVSVVYLLYKEKFLYAALIMSFSLYARTEGLFLSLYILAYLAAIRQWKYIPFLFTGFLVYSLAGLFSGHSFLWYFTENPYAFKSPYGHGNWFDFFDKYHVIWGKPGTIGLVIGIILALYMSLKKIRQLHFTNLLPDHKFILLVMVPAFLFFGFHVIVWKFGLCGSCGLERVIACVLPLFSLITCYGINEVSKWKRLQRFSLPVVIAYCIVTILFVFKKHYPLKATGEDKVESETGKWFKNTINQNCTIYYAHPGIVFYSDRNPFDKNRNIEQFGFKPEQLSQKNRPTYIFWDSQFSDFNCNVKLESLLNSSQLKLIRHSEDKGFHLYVFELI